MASVCSNTIVYDVEQSALSIFDEAQLVDELYQSPEQMISGTFKFLQNNSCVHEKTFEIRRCDDNGKYKICIKFHESSISVPSLKHRVIERKLTSLYNIKYPKAVEEPVKASSQGSTLCKRLLPSKAEKYPREKADSYQIRNVMHLMDILPLTQALPHKCPFIMFDFDEVFSTHIFDCIFNQDDYRAEQVQFVRGHTLEHIEYVISELRRRYPDAKIIIFSNSLKDVLQIKMQTLGIKHDLFDGVYTATMQEREDHVSKGKRLNTIIRDFSMTNFDSLWMIDDMLYNLNTVASAVFNDIGKDFCGIRFTGALDKQHIELCSAMATNKLNDALEAFEQLVMTDSKKTEPKLEDYTFEDFYNEPLYTESKKEINEFKQRLKLIENVSFDIPPQPS